MKLNDQKELRELRKLCIEFFIASKESHNHPITLTGREIYKHGGRLFKEIEEEDVGLGYVRE